MEQGNVGLDADRKLIIIKIHAEIQIFHLRSNLPIRLNYLQEPRQSITWQNNVQT